MAANDKNQVSVALRLTLDQLKSDIQKAAASMKAGLAGGTKGIAADTDKATSSMGKLENQVKKTTNAFKDQKKAALEAWKNSLPTPKVTISGQALPGYKPTSGNPFQAIANAARGQYGMATNPQSMLGNAINQATNNGKYRGYGMADLKQRGFMGNPMLPSGGAPTFPKGTPAPTGLQTPLAIAAQVGAVLAGLRVAIGLVKYAFEAVLQPIRMLAEAAQRAAKTITSAMLSGKPVGYQVATSNISSVLGGSEHDAIVFAYSIKGLNERMVEANKTMTELAPSLLQLHVALSTLRLSFQALKMQFLSGFGEAVKQVAEALRVFFDVIKNSYIANAISTIIGLVAKMVAAFVSYQAMLASTMQIIVNVIADSIAFLLNRSMHVVALAINGILDMIPGGKHFKLDAGNIGTSPWLSKETLAMIAAMKQKPEVSANPVSSAHRMVASAWERMGLVIGGGSIGNYQKDIAKNTKETNSILKSGFSGSGIARSGIAVFSPQQAQP